jgi:hypothetical protein
MAQIRKKFDADLRERWVPPFASGTRATLLPSPHTCSTRWPFRDPPTGRRAASQPRPGRKGNAHPDGWLASSLCRDPPISTRSGRLVLGLTSIRCPPRLGGSQTHPAIHRAAPRLDDHPGAGVLLERGKAMIPSAAPATFASIISDAGATSWLWHQPPWLWYKSSSACHTKRRGAL